MAFAQAPDVTSSSSQTIEPGGWVSLAFRVADQPMVEEDQPCRETRLILPPGWSVLIPPTSIPCPINAPVVLTTTIGAPKDAMAGRYDVVLALGSAEASAAVTVAAEHALSVAFRVETDPPVARWWIATPMEVPLDLTLTGNRVMSVRLQAKGPDGIEVEISPETLKMRPYALNTATVLVRAKDLRRWPAGAQIPIRIIALDEENKILKTASQTWVVQTDVGAAEPQPTWPITGYVQSQHQWQHSTRTDFDWGLSGQWPLHHEGQGFNPLSHVHFSWSSDRPWQRYVAYDSEAIQIRLGHQVFGERGVARPLTSARGVSLSGGQRTRIGFDVFEAFHDSHERYYRPWLQQGAWRYAWTQRLRADGENDQGWSLAYQPNQHQSAGHARLLDFQVAGSAAGLATWADISDRLSENLRYRMQFQSVPKDHLSGLVPGQRWRLDVVTSRQASMQSGWMVALRRNDQRMIDHHVMGYVKKQLWGSVNAGLSSEYASTKKSPSLDLSLWGRWSSMAWRAGLSTLGRWQLSLRGQTNHVGRWHMHHRQSHDGQRALRIGLEGRHGQLWRWAVAIENNELVSLSQPLSRSYSVGMSDFVDFGFSPMPMSFEMDVQHIKAISLLLARQVGRTGEWSLQGQQSLSSEKAGSLVLRYRWQHRFKAPIRTMTSSSVVKGQVIRQEPSGPVPVAGAWVWLGMRSTPTDANGKYRFREVQPGLHRVQLEEQKSNLAWLPRDGDSQEVVVDRAKAVILDWTLVAMGSIKGQIHWPVSLSKERPNWSEYHLMGRCMDCALTHRHHQISVNGDGRFEAKLISPGLWQWRLIGPAFPKDDIIVPEAMETLILSGEQAMLEWDISHQPTPVQWQANDAVLIIP